MKVVIKRRLERGVETVECPIPLLITVHGTAPECRPRNAKAVMKYKRATCPSERQELSEDYTYIYNEKPYLNIEEWSAKDIDIDVDMVGLAGSPTKVKKIDFVVLQAKEAKKIEPTDEGIDQLMKELISNHTLG